MPNHRHVVLLKWKAGTTADQIEHVKKSVLDLPNQIPNILSYRWYSLLNSAHPAISSQGFTHVVDSIFVSCADMLTYDAHPVHAKLVSQDIAPVVEKLLVADHALPESFNLDEYLKQESQPHVHWMQFITPKPGLDLSPLIATYQKAPTAMDEVIHVDAGVRVSNLPIWLADLTHGRTLCVDVLLDKESSLDKFVHHSHYQELLSVLKFYADLEEDSLSIAYEAGQ